MREEKKRSIIKCSEETKEAIDYKEAKLDY